MPKRVEPREGKNIHSALEEIIADPSIILAVDRDSEDGDLLQMIISVAQALKFRINAGACMSDVEQGDSLLEDIVAVANKALGRPPTRLPSLFEVKVEPVLDNVLRITQQYALDCIDCTNDDCGLRDIDVPIESVLARITNPNKVTRKNSGIKWRQ